MGKIDYAIINRAKEILTKEYLIEEYINQNKTPLEIAHQLGLKSEVVVCKVLKQHAITKSKDLINACRKRLQIEAHRKLYGVDYPFELKSQQDKVKQTLKERYGVESHFAIPEVKKQIKQTWIEKYGEDNPQKVNEIKKRTLQTNLERYGCKVALGNPEVQRKLMERNLEKYGVEWTCCLPIVQKHTKTISAINLQFSELLDKEGIEYELEFRLGGRIYDFKVRDILIEINPAPFHNATWHPFNEPREKDYHKGKTELALQNGYRCIHVWDWDDWGKIVNLIKQRKRLFARNCSIKEVDDVQANEFINQNHLQNNCRGTKVYLGLYIADKLVQIMSFGKPRYNKCEWELLRLCSTAQVLGGTEKLFKYFIKNYNPNSIVSYCDNSKFTGNVYGRLGFRKISSGSPTKHWYEVKTHTHITDNLLRSRGADQLIGTHEGKGSNNEEIMINNGFVIIYDCGQSTFIWNKEKSDARI